MTKNTEKPSAQAKALSLFLMAHKTKTQKYKEKFKRIKRLWSMVLNEKISKSDYAIEVESMLTSLGGYDEVVEKTVRFYIDKTGEWKLQGEDKYCIDAKKIADQINSK
jgi:hypothetical protein